MSPEVQNRGISGPTKRAHVLQKILKKEKKMKTYKYVRVDISYPMSIVMLRFSVVEAHTFFVCLAHLSDPNPVLGER